ncbi:FecR family protein [bacterium]|nr:FecR family protein [bacterium]
MARNRILQYSGIALAIVMMLPIMLSVVSAQEGTVIAVVERINGALQYRENTSTEWKAAKVKQPLYNGFQLRTETGNKALILYVSSGSRVLVNENTELEVQAQSATPGGKPTGERTRLMIGEVYSKVTQGSKYDVETPTSVASVRGTEFNASFDNGEASYLVVESVVEVMNQLGSVLLSQLQGITVGTGEAPDSTKVQKLSQDQVNQMTGWTNQVEPSWKLNMNIEQGDTHEMGTSFAMTIFASDPKTGSMDSNAAFALSSLSSSNDILEFSTDNGKTWTNAPQVNLVSGQARVLIRPTAEGSADVIAQATNCEPAGVTITVSKAKKKIKIDLIFTDPDGTNEKTLTLELEEK